MHVSRTDEWAVRVLAIMIYLLCLPGWKTQTINSQQNKHCPNGITHVVFKRRPDVLASVPEAVLRSGSKMRSAIFRCM